MTLRLRPFTEEDEAAARAADEQSAAERQRFLFHLEGTSTWSEVLERFSARRLGHDLPEGIVRSAMLAAVAGEQLVGRVSIRFELTPPLKRGPGHIGYHVIEEFRGRGYATEMLRQALIIARSEGVDHVLVTCDVDNLASARVIEKCGGELADTVESSLNGLPIHRYWIV